NLPNGIGPRPVTSGVAARLPGPNSHAGTRHQSGNGLLDPPPDPSVEHLCYTPVPGRSPSATAEYGILQELTRPAGAGPTPSRRMPEILLQSGQLRPRNAEVLELLLRGHLERNADLGRLLDVVGSLAPASVALARAAGLTNHSGSVRSTTATLVRKNYTDEP